MQNKKLIIVFLFLGTIVNVFPQHSYRNAVLLTHSSGSRLYDYEAYMNVDSGDITSVPLEMDAYNTSHSYTGNNEVKMVKRWFPEPEGTDWYNWLMAFRETLPSDDIWAKIDSFDITIIKGGIQTCNMVGYGSSSDTSGGSVTNKTIQTYKWIWREIVELMETRPDKFFVIMTGSASGDENNTPTGARLAHEFAVWAKDTLANGNDPVYGTFPENVYIFDYFHYLADNEYYLKDEYESGYQGGVQDDHPNATACNDIAPIFVQEVFDAAIAYEQKIITIDGDLDPIHTYSLEQNYPNPFNPITEIKYTLAKSENITLKVYNSLGSEVATLVNGFMNIGTHSVRFNAKGLTSGIYFYKIKSDNFTSTRKMLLIK